MDIKKVVVEIVDGEKIAFVELSNQDNVIYNENTKNVFREFFTGIVEGNKQFTNFKLVKPTNDFNKSLIARRDGFLKII